MGIASDFFLELLHVLAQLLECQGGFGNFFGDDGALLGGHLLGLAVGGGQLLNGALQTILYNQTNADLRQVNRPLACWLSTSSLSESP